MIKHVKTVYPKLVTVQPALINFRWSEAMIKKFDGEAIRALKMGCLSVTDDL